MNATLNVFQYLFHDFETSYVNQNVNSAYLTQGTASTEGMADVCDLKEPFGDLLDVDITSRKKQYT
jgi:hypothetical protein